MITIENCTFSGVQTWLDSSDALKRRLDKRPAATTLSVQGSHVLNDNSGRPIESPLAVSELTPAERGDVAEDG